MSRRENNMVAARKYREKQHTMWKGILQDLKSCNMIPRCPPDSPTIAKYKKYLLQHPELSRLERNAIHARIYRARRDAFREKCLQIWQSFMETE